MNDTPETRLRDALEAAARTIPDGTQPPAFTAPERVQRSRPGWVVLAAAATVAAAVAVPVALQQGDPEPALTACPGGQTAAPPPMPMELPTESLRTSSSPSPREDDRKLAMLPIGEPPRVPYTVTDRSGAGFLQDGNTRVALPGGMQTQVIERLDCRWLVVRTEMIEFGNPGKGEVGILDAFGSFTRLGVSEPPREDRKGRTGGLSVGMSPDGTKLAYTFSTPDRRSYVAAVSVASGKEIARVRVSGTTGVIAWNAAGVWLGSGSGIKERRYERWLPGSVPQPVHGPGVLYAYRTTDRMAWAWGKSQGTTVCATVVTGATRLMEACGGSLGSETSLSPDGQTLLHALKVWRVADGSERPTPNWWYPPQYAVWEDNTHVLVGGGWGVLVRCNVDTAACERILVSAESFRLDLIEQGPYKVLGMGG